MNDWAGRPGDWADAPEYPEWRPVPPWFGQPEPEVRLAGRSRLAGLQIKPPSYESQPWLPRPKRGKSSVQPGLRRQIYQECGRRCQLRLVCDGKRELSWAEFTVDHTIPRSRGGRSVRKNLKGACAPCNQFKADKLPDQLTCPGA